MHHHQQHQQHQQQQFSYTAMGSGSGSGSGGGVVPSDGGGPAADPTGEGEGGGKAEGKGGAAGAQVGTSSLPLSRRPPLLSSEDSHEGMSKSMYTTTSPIRSSSRRGRGQQQRKLTEAEQQRLRQRVHWLSNTPEFGSVSGRVLVMWGVQQCSAVQFRSDL